MTEPGQEPEAENLAEEELDEVVGGLNTGDNGFVGEAI